MAWELEGREGSCIKLSPLLFEQSKKLLSIGATFSIRSKFKFGREGGFGAESEFICTGGT